MGCFLLYTEGDLGDTRARDGKGPQGTDNVSPLHSVGPRLPWNTPAVTQDGPTCALACSAMVINSLHGGEEVALPDLRDFASVEGLSDSDGGMNPESVRELLDDYPGIKAEVVANSSLEDVGARLARGEELIAAVSAEVLYERPDLGGHTLYVVGLDQAHDGREVVLVRDPNCDHKNLWDAIPRDAFEKAWRGYGDNVLIAAHRE